MKISNEVVVVSNYATEYLNKTLSAYGDAGYKLVSTLLAPNEFNVQVMYLFFTKEENEEVKNYERKNFMQSI